MRSAAWMMREIETDMFLIRLAVRILPRETIIGAGWSRSVALFRSRLQGRKRTMWEILLGEWICSCSLVTGTPADGIAEPEPCSESP